MLDSLLVANRGEIAVRVLRAARAAGVWGIAVYSDADRHALHVREADVALRLGPAPASESYLSVEALLAAARRAGARAVHPGYGFLSENAAFARACVEAGLTWVGPPAEVIERMGAKDEARRIALAADVPVVPALEDEGDEALLARAGDEVGFPLMIKAVAGGGGKGMRVVRAAGELEGALAAARREARSAFGDERVLVERYVERPRHVEVQVLADAHGHVVHLLERDCSVQRRHQKVVEEAPAPTISPAVRERLTTAAVRLAREVGYVNAGTVEFMVSGEEVLFLEMNTRLQVEHPVTEAICGRDLVALQLLVAAGEELPFGQDDVAAVGHAIEARVYAEDPAHGFLPQAGRASAVRWSPRARVDAALVAGQEVTTHYDPMLAKLTVHAASREAARRALVGVLDDSAVLGVTTNLGFLRRLVASDTFAGAEIDTGWLDREEGAFATGDPTLALVAAAWVLASGGAGGREGAGEGGDAADPGPFAAGDGWRLGAPPAPVGLDLVVGDERHAVRVDRHAGRVAEGERCWTVRPAGAEGERPGDPEPEREGDVLGPTGLRRLALEIDGTLRAFALRLDGTSVTVGHEGDSWVVRHPEPFGALDDIRDGDGSVVAPMPGTVLQAAGEAGQAVEEGQTLVVLEAMKMELSLDAPIAGTLTELRVRPGDRVALGDVLFVVSANGDGQGE